MPTIDQLSINLATVREKWDLRQAVEGCARAGISAVAPWRDQVARIGLQESARIIRDHEMRVSGLCRGGMFPAATEAGRRAADDENLKALEEAVTLGAQCLVIVVGGLPEGSRDIGAARGMVEEGLDKLLQAARPAGMPIAIEPLHPMYAADRACVNTLRQALDMAGRLGDGVGVAADVYHIWWDPEVEAQIARAGSEGRLLAYHICDWLVPTKDLLLDRGMMGDGVIDLPRLRGAVEAAGYDGLHEVEIFSANDWWKRDPEEVLRTCIERHAEMT
ncbi:sugar phosphate isomerase/epimerase [Pikeienuella piscinae]|uniref:Sugar phosphate isomerase/epimerase n=1 Tax=Pikeienuella piscinae TaxID=2748098 RepID=A0A7L5BVZ1_9RHOB|nr:sugar phosphate isomerase/epimerase family protein [Pikeienuella piscinae]QIE54998.1 sugar phosphate isomerase/epimerase [Pikeienuella piscinae]